MPADQAGRRPAALLWDFDGTLVDSEESWFAAEVRLMAGWGEPWTREQAAGLVGLGLDEYARVLLAAAGRTGDVGHHAEILHDHALEDMRARGVATRPGALELLRSASDAGVPCALVSATYGRVLRAVVDLLAPGAFSVVVGGDDVSRTKPHPEPYLRAAELLGVDPRACVAVEDSRAGTASALAAGCVVLAVPFRQSPETGPRVVLRPTIEGLTFDDVTTLWQERRRA